MIQLSIAPKRVLVVAQNLEGIAHLIAPLREAGCRVELATTPIEAIGRAAVLAPEVVVIEDQMSSVNSVELSMQIRSLCSADAAPMFIMARAHELASATERERPAEPEQSERPDSAPDLVHRIVGLMAPMPLRHDARPPDRLNCRGLCLDRMRHRARIHERTLKLTPTEFRLLWELAGRPGCVLSRIDLTKVCKGVDLPMQSRTIDAHIKSIRRKLKADSYLIETVHGVGYRFQDLEW